MAKPPSFTCTECGAAHAKWSGRCEACGAWNAIVEEKPLSTGPGAKALGAKRGRAMVLEPLAGLDPNGVYWMWVADQNGERFTAGTFRGAPKDHMIRMQSALPMNEAVRVWCTDDKQDVVLDSWVQK